MTMKAKASPMAVPTSSGIDRPDISSATDVAPPRSSGDTNARYIHRPAPSTRKTCVEKPAAERSTSGIMKPIATWK